MDPLLLIHRFYPTESPLRELLICHSQAVAEKATLIAHNLKMAEQEIQFIQEACLLHDLGIFLTDAPTLGCYGTLPYICHGYLGHDLLLKEGLPKHALVCERHTGTGISLKEVLENQLPIPGRHYFPITLQEQIITYSDKFFSKEGDLRAEKSIEEIIDGLKKYGPEKADRFLTWHQQFSHA